MRLDKRGARVEQFQTDKNCRVAILSITAAGVGISLTSASLCIFCEMYWTPGVLAQAEARLHRIKQESVVEVRYLVLEKSVDDVMWNMIKSKHEVLTKTMGDQAEILLESDKKTDSMQRKLSLMMEPVARAVPISEAKSKIVIDVDAEVRKPVSSPPVSPAPGKTWSRQTTLDLNSSPIKKQPSLIFSSASPASSSVDDAAPPGFRGYRVKRNRMPTQRVALPLGSTFQQVLDAVDPSRSIPTSILCLGKKYGLEERVPDVNDTLIVFSLKEEGPSQSPTLKRDEVEILSNPTPAKKVKLVSARSLAQSSVSALRDNLMMSNSPPAKRDAPMSSPTALPRCKYWDQCYRKNPNHFLEFSHPPRGE
jgi:hypothetical protein